MSGDGQGSLGFGESIIHGQRSPRGCRSSRCGLHIGSLRGNQGSLVAFLQSSGVSGDGDGGIMVTVGEGGGLYPEFGPEGPDG